MIKINHQKFKKKQYCIIAMMTGMIGIFSVASACAVVPFYIAPKSTNHAVNSVPEASVYQIAHNLTFSLQFDNSGGYHPSGSDNKNERINERKGPYSEFGTGWLFDWNLDSTTPDENGNFTWTGYFATNVHVVDGLLNKDDGDIYTPSWLRVGSIGHNSQGDQTTAFSLGKFDNSPSTLNSLQNNANITSIPLSTLPKTFYTGLNFYNKKVNVSPYKNTILNDNFYLDFAVLAISIKYFQTPINDQQQHEKLVYENWIVPAMEILKNHYGPDAYTRLFDNTNLINEYNNSGKTSQNDYAIGGYPVYRSNSDQNIPPPHYTNRRVGLDGNHIGNPNGSPAWTINTSNNNLNTQGQKLATNNEQQNLSAPDQSGLYSFGSKISSQTLYYHGEKYLQYGLGYVIDNSNLQGGSSGSAIFSTKPNDSSKSKISAIYFGTFKPKNFGKDSKIGLGMALIVPEYNRGKIRADFYENLIPYNLLAGNQYMNNATKSDDGVIYDSFYRQKLADANINSNLFKLAKVSK